eukprot:jgi/Bigna1/140209/aug1.54_g14917
MLNKLTKYAVELIFLLSTIVGCNSGGHSLSKRALHSSSKICCAEMNYPVSAVVHIPPPVQLRNRKWCRRTQSIQQHPLVGLRRIKLQSRQATPVAASIPQTQPTARRHKLLIKVEIPSSISRSDLMEQFLRWAFVELAENGKENIGIDNIDVQAVYLKDDSILPTAVEESSSSSSPMETRSAFNKCKIVFTYKSYNRSRLVRFSIPIHTIIPLLFFFNKHQVNPKHEIFDPSKSREVELRRERATGKRVRYDRLGMMPVSTNDEFEQLCQQQDYHDGKDGDDINNISPSYAYAYENEKHYYEVLGKYMEIRRLMGNGSPEVVTEETATAVRAFIAMLNVAFDKYYAFGSMFADDAM